MWPRFARRLEPDELLPESLGAFDEVGWNNIVFENFLIVVDVSDEKVERHGALLQAALQDFPIVGFDNAWEDIEGEDFFGSRLVTIDGERDARLKQGGLGGFLTLYQLSRREVRNALSEGLSTRTRDAGGLKEFIVEAVGLIVGEIQSSAALRVGRWKRRWVAVDHGRGRIAKRVPPLECGFRGKERVSGGQPVRER